MPRSPNGMEQSLDLWPVKASGFETQSAGENAKNHRFLVLREFLIRVCPGHGE